MKKRIAKTFIFAVIAAAPFLWTSILTVNGTGGWSTAGIELLIFPILLVFIIWLLLSIIRMIQFLARKGQAENEGRSSPITLGIVIGGVLGILVGGELRMYGFELAAERAAPLIEAIESYAHDNSKPPATLDALVPNYLTELPAKLPPLEIVTDSQQLSEYGDNP